MPRPRASSRRDALRGPCVSDRPRTRVPVGRPRPLADDDQAMVLEPGSDTSRTSGRSPPSWPTMARAASTSSASGSRFQATRSPSTATSGIASSASSGSAATARATTTGQASRCAGSAASVSRAVGRDGDPVGEAEAVHGGAQEHRLLGDGLDEERARGERCGQWQARKATARPEVEEPLGPLRPEQRDGGEAVEDVEGGGRDRVADGRQIDRLVPGQQQPDVAVDDIACARRKVDPERRQARSQGGGVWRGQGIGVLDARRERSSRAFQRHPSCGRADRSVRKPLPASTSCAGAVRVRSSPIRSVVAPVSRNPSRVELPSPLAHVRRPDATGRTTVRQGGLSTNPRTRTASCG